MAANEPKTDPEETKAEPNLPAGGEDTEAKADPEPAAAGYGEGDGEEEVADKHGMPGINREKYNRDMAAKDEEIAALKAQIAEAAKTEEGRKALEEKIAQLESSHKDERVTYDLKLAGIRDEKAVKAAKAMLPDYGGDVAKLKEECPYLFSEAKQTGSTGLKHEGGAGSEDTDAKLDKIWGVDDD